MNLLCIVGPLPIRRGFDDWSAEVNRGVVGSKAEVIYQGSISHARVGVTGAVCRRPYFVWTLCHAMSGCQPDTGAGSTEIGTILTVATKCPPEPM